MTLVLADSLSAPAGARLAENFPTAYSIVIARTLHKDQTRHIGWRRGLACLETGWEWVRHMIYYGGRVDGGMQIPVIDTDQDDDLDLVVAGKSGFLF